jgi:hypothetical protein
MERTHNERFAELQEKYFEAREAGDKKADYWLNKMYLLVVDVAKNYINDYSKKKGIRIGDWEEKAHDAAVYCISQYLRKSGFRIDRISAYARYGMLKALFNKNTKDSEMTESYEYYFNDKERGRGNDFYS